MSIGQGARLSNAPPAQSFSNLVAGSTTRSFTLPAGVYELQWSPADQNTPGTLTLTVPTDNTGVAITSSNSYTLTLSTGLGAFPGLTGCLWFQTLGSSMFKIAVTAAGSVSIFQNGRADGG